MRPAFRSAFDFLRVALVSLLVLLWFAVGGEAAWAEKLPVGYTEQVLKVTLSKASSWRVSSPAYELRVRAEGASGYSVLLLESPSRLVLDLEGVKIPRNRSFKVEEDVLLSGLRLGVQPSGVRVVVDFIPAVTPHYSARADGEDLVFLFDGGEGGTAGSKPDSAAEYSEAPAEIAQEAVPGLEAASSAPLTGIVGIEERAVPGIPTPAAGELQTAQSETEMAAKASEQVLPSVQRAFGPKPAAPAVMAATRVLPEREPGIATVTPIMKDAPAGSGEAVPSTQESGERSLVSEVKLESLLRFSVDRLFVYFEHGGLPVQNVVVKSKSDDTLYMNVVVAHVQNAGGENEEGLVSDGVLVSPRRFKLEAGEQRTVRLVLKKPAGQSEEIYRISFVPQADSFEKKLASLSVSGRTLEFNVVASLALNVSVQPAEPEGTVNWEYRKGALRLVNMGNTSVLMEGGRVCPEEEDKCLALPSRRLYPGNIWDVKLPRRGSVKFVKRMGADYEALIIPPEGV